MGNTAKEQELPPYTDHWSHNLILQLKNAQTYTEDDLYWDCHHAEDILGRNLLPSANRAQDAGDDRPDYANIISRATRTNDDLLRFTPQFYTSIRDEEARMNAYRALSVFPISTRGEDQEIENNPFTFLYLPEDASFTQVRDAYLRLSKMHHPDIVSQQYPANNVPNPDIQNDNERYEAEQKVRVDRLLQATQQMTIINKAYASAKRRFSTSQIESLAGFQWETVFFSHDRPDIRYDVLNLEGVGQLRRTGTRNIVQLVFDYGDREGAEHEFRQTLQLRAFFAWTELVQQKGLAPTLLEDINREYGLHHSGSEQLRLMMMNHEAPLFIIEALGISTQDRAHYNLYHFLIQAYYGPLNSYQVGYHAEANDETIYSSLGIALTPDGGLHIQYNGQLVAGFLGALEPREVQFTPADVRMMQSLAYGPLLDEPAK